MISKVLTFLGILCCLQYASASATEISLGKVTVDAQQGWQLAAKNISKGTLVSLVSEGEWTLARGQWDNIGADGYDVDDFGCPLGSLIGAVDPNEHLHSYTQGRHILSAKIICLGSKAQFIMPEDGHLFLRINDGLHDEYYLLDNEGAVSVNMHLQLDPKQPIDLQFAKVEQNRSCVSDVNLYGYGMQGVASKDHTNIVIRYKPDALRGFYSYSNQWGPQVCSNQSIKLIHNRGWQYRIIGAEHIYNLNRKGWLPGALKTAVLSKVNDQVYEDRSTSYYMQNITYRKPSAWSVCGSQHLNLELDLSIETRKPDTYTPVKNQDQRFVRHSLSTYKVEWRKCSVKNSLQ